MCLYISKTRNINHVFPKGSKERTFYKVVRVNYLIDNTPQLIGPYKYYYKYKPGLNKSSRIEWVGTLATDLTDHELQDNIVEQGIHVCTSKKRATKIKNCLHNCKVLLVTCYKKDFIAVGQKQDAVFTQVFISKADYKKALKNG